MRTTLDIDADLLEKVRVLTGASRKKKAVAIALAEYVRAKRRAKLLAWIDNSLDLDLDLKDMEKMRSEG